MPNPTASAHLTYRQHTCTVHEHRFTVPLDHSNPADTRTIEIFAREVIRPGGENRPHLVYLQGGPGYGAARPGDFRDGWLGHLLEKYRVVLLDQRGTGQSGRLDSRSVIDSGIATGNPDTAATAQEIADYLAFFRQDQIVHDAEVVRQALTDGKPWTTLGQSFGGFITTSYLSLAPEGLERCLITGGLPGLVHIDDIYRLTYRATAARNHKYFARFPADEATIRHIAAHLHDTEELLPTGERLTPSRFRMIGLSLGTQTRFDLLHYLLEGPWVTVRGQRRLSGQFLEDVAAELAMAPMYGALHELIYASATPELAGTATAWSADRLAEATPGFAADADPLDTSEPYYLTGEHMRRSLFEESPALRPFAEAVDALAARTDLPPVYLPEVLADNDIPVAAAVYDDDMYVPRKLSMDTALAIKGTKTWVTSEYQHDGLRASGTRVVEHLLALLDD